MARSPSKPLAEPQGFFERTRFAGTLSGHGASISMGFYASIDSLGVLRLELDRIPFSREAYALCVDQRPGTNVDLIALEGRSEAGHVFRSDSFHISSFSHGSELGAELSYQGDCQDAELELPRRLHRENRSDARVWRVRQFRTFRHMTRDTELGRMVIGGPRQDREAQEPNGYIAVYRPDGDSSESWWQDSDRLLTHMARVLSFACDTYLRPLIEERYEDDRITVRVARQGRASGPFMAPFHELHMDPIFACACEAYFSRYEAVEDLDAAIRWVTAPVAYDESRLINAMSALENILDRCGLDEVDLFMRPNAFRRIASQVRDLLSSCDVPEGMARKLPELNRRPLGEKILALVAARGIVTNDFPEGWLRTVIVQRNTIVHTGISRDFDDQEPDTLDHTIWAREIVTRIILERLGFEGPYRSWLHHDEQLHFPECIAMQDWAPRREADRLLE